MSGNSKRDENSFIWRRNLHFFWAIQMEDLNEQFFEKL